MKNANTKVDAVLFKATKWKKEFEKLRKIALDCGLTEELKWGQPCYTSGKANIVLIHGFKEYWQLLFFKGPLLKDPEGILIIQTENVQSARQIRFQDVREITARAAVVTGYIYEAIDVEKSGRKVTLKKTQDFAIAEEFQQKLDESPALKAAFDRLTPGRQRGYLLHFSGAKQSNTRESRVKKCIPMILSGKGLLDDKPD